MLGTLCPVCQLAQRRGSRVQMHEDTSHAMDRWDEEPEHRLAKELHLDREITKKVGDILYDAQRNDLSRRNTLLAVRSVLKPYQQEQFDQIITWSWWQDWPFGRECIANDEESMMACPCDSCASYRMNKSHRERQAERFESMLDDLREKAEKPFYRGWKVPRRNPDRGRPRNIKRHLSFNALHDTSIRIPEEDRRYRCDCGVIGDAWTMDYTPCATFSPGHASQRLKRPTWMKCTLCSESWDMPAEGYSNCPVTGQNHGWMDPKPLIDDSLYVCQNCNQTGPFHELAYSRCSEPDLEPCEYCNIAVMCASDCPGMGAAFGELIKGVIDEHEEDDSEAWGQSWVPDN